MNIATGHNKHRNATPFSECVHHSPGFRLSLSNRKSNRKRITGYDIETHAVAYILALSVVCELAAFAAIIAKWRGLL